MPVHEVKSPYDIFASANTLLCLRFWGMVHIPQKRFINFKNMPKEINFVHY